MRLFVELVCHKEYLRKISVKDRQKEPAERSMLWPGGRVIISGTMRHGIFCVYVNMSRICGIPSKWGIS